MSKKVALTQQHEYFIFLIGDPQWRAYGGGLGGARAPLGTSCSTQSSAFKYLINIIFDNHMSSHVLCNNFGFLSLKLYIMLFLLGKFSNYLLSLSAPLQSCAPRPSARHWTPCVFYRQSKQLIMKVVVNKFLSS